MRRLAQAIIVMALALMPFFASAQTSVTSSGFQVQNLNESQAANIVITYYNADGSQAATQTQAIPAGGSLTFFNGQGGTVAMSAPSGFRGSVVISSDQPIAAITNLLGTGLGEAYGGFSSGSGTVSVPLVARNNGFSTTLTVQNTGSAATTINVAYTPGVAGNTGQTDTATIAPGAAVTFSQGDKAGLGDRFVGSATITAASGGSIVAVVNQETGSSLLTYNAFTAGGTSIAAPLVVANNFGGLTGIQVQNTGTAAANVTVTYSANSVTTAPGSQAVCATPPAATFSLAGGASKTLIQAGGSATEGFDPFFASCRYVGGATITSDGSPLVAIVNQISGGSASAYESFNTAAATGTSKVPLAAANNFGLFTGIQVQNVGTASTDVTVTYGPNTLAAGDGICGTPTARTQSIAAGASFTFIQSGAGTAADGFDSQFATCRYVGSATITAASGGKVVAIVNQISGAGNDQLFTYNAFSQ